MEVISNSLFVLFVCSFLSLSQQCTNPGYPFENHLSSKTPYRFVSNQSFDRILYEGCIPQKIWMLVRHGTRYPEYGFIEKMTIRLPEIKDLILQNKDLPNEYVKSRDVDVFQKWKPYVQLADKKKLVHEGEEEMLLLAERMQSRFPELFDSVYSNTSYKFKYTYSQRTHKSALYFTSGLFGRAAAKDIWFPEPSRKDPILRFYKLCTRWENDVKQNSAAQQERIIFMNGAEMSKTVQEINERLKMKKTLLETEDIIMMYDMCAYETAWNKLAKSPWCSVFTVDNLKVLEYAADLKHYWRDGYGFELTYKQACPAFGDMMNFLESKSRFPRVNVYFTHSGTLLKMLAHLGLYEDDEHLTAKNFDHMLTRKWRTSLIDSFGTNLAFVLYSCDSVDKLLVLHQEKIVRLPPCPDSDLCEVDKIKEFYGESLDSCDFQGMCNSTYTQRDVGEA
ncbi:unnamed protein product [Phaedon cochleariae]|uniref:Multiple inositol polyphosphate phosphatase 1 n=1 Tax=Phaedon cochleariae TaxID=80249 RepID=A0A9P0DUY7_PHACE|nr:unnamed protein product [Phaedon cochleariae]